MHMRINAPTRSVISGLLVCLLGLSPLLVLAEETPASAEKRTAAAVAPAEPKVFSDFNKIIADAMGLLPVEQDRFEGSSLLPFGSRAKAIDEAKGKAANATYHAFFIERDVEERRTGIISGIHRVVHLRGVAYVEKTPENVMKLVEQGPANRLTAVLTEALKQPEYAAYVPRMKELVRQAASRGGAAGLSASALVDVVIAHEGKAVVEDLKKWAKYYPNGGVRLQAYVGLIQVGELDFAESSLKEEQDKVLQMQVGEKIKRARLGV